MSFTQYFAEGLMIDKTGNLPFYFYGSGAALAVAANTSVIAAVTGQKIRVTKIWLANGGAAGSIIFRNGNAGALITTFIDVDAPAGFHSTRQLPFDPTGYCETSAGVGLYADIAGSAIWVGLQFILVTP